MPTDTFMKLSDNKKEKIIQSAKKEFSRVPVEEASIKNIVQDAEIARGSFYQYFKSKEDLLSYILESYIEEVNTKIEKTLIDTNGDIFAAFFTIYNSMTNAFVNESENSFYRNIFENLKTSEDNIFSFKINKCSKTDFSRYYDLIDKTKFNVQNSDDIRLICNMLSTITKKAIVSSFKYSSKEKAEEDYLRQIEFLKYGILKI